MKKPLWWIKLTNYEYWPFFVLYSPTAMYWTWLIIKSRSLTFFTLANPPEEFGGFFGESKVHTLDKIQAKYLPVSAPVSLGDSPGDVKIVMKNAGITFPMIIKPNWGERGVNVELVHNDDELAAYLEKTDRDSILQEYIEYPIELGVFYHRYPDGSHSGITGITEKRLMTVTGDGRSTIRELMEAKDRFRFQIERMENNRRSVLNRVLPEGEVFLVEPIGNHNRGTKFMDGSRRINDQLVRVFDDVSSTIDGFYYGRFDVKVRDWEGLYRGEGIKVLELNGVYSEPAHIYDPTWKLTDAWREIIRHMKVIYDLSAFNRKRGLKPSTTSHFLRMVWRNFFKNKQVV